MVRCNSRDKITVSQSITTPPIIFRTCTHTPHSQLSESKRGAVECKRNAEGGTARREASTSHCSQGVRERSSVVAVIAVSVCSIYLYIVVIYDKVAVVGWRPGRLFSIVSLVTVSLVYTIYTDSMCRLRSSSNGRKNKETRRGEGVKNNNNNIVSDRGERKRDSGQKTNITRVFIQNPCNFFSKKGRSRYGKTGGTMIMVKYILSRRKEDRWALRIVKGAKKETEKWGKMFSRANLRSKWRRRGQKI